MNSSNLLKVGIAAVVSVGWCAGHGGTTAQAGVNVSGERICLVAATETLNAPSGRPEMEVRPGTNAPRQKLERVLFSEMMFSNKSDRLSDVGIGRCYLVAQKLRHGTSVTVVVQGHDGPSALNQQVCMGRAEAVRQELQNFGISESRMSTVRFGEASASFKADWARVVHERAEFEIEAEDRGTSSNKNPAPAGKKTL